MAEFSAGIVQPPEEDVLRARLYGFLARLLSEPPGRETLGILRRLEPGEGEIGRAIGDLAEAAETVEPEAAEAEFNALFIGLTRGELVPYASYYMAGFLYEKPLAELRADLARFGIERSEGVHEPEDHLAALFEVMQGLIMGEFGEAAGLAEQRQFFSKHIEPWASRFFIDLEATPSARLYRPVGRLGALFMAVEGEAFKLV